MAQSTKAVELLRLVNAFSLVTISEKLSCKTKLNSQTPTSCRRDLCALRVAFSPIFSTIHRFRNRRSSYVVKRATDFGNSNGIIKPFEPSRRTTSSPSSITSLSCVQML